MTEGTYKQLFYNSPVPMYVYDDITYYFYAANDAALQQYGYTEAEFLQLKATDIRPPEDVAAFQQANQEVPERYIDFGSWRHIRKNGEVFHVHIFGHTTEFEGKKVRVVVAVDIEHKVKTETELASKNREIANILESTTDGFYALNRNWEVTYFNHSAERVLGCTREEILGKNIWDFFPDSRQGRFYEEYNRVMNERVSIHFDEYYAPLKVWGAMHVYPTPDGIAVYFADITEQKKIQEKIARDEENLRAIINNTTDLIWSIDRDNRFISANNAFWQRLDAKTGRRTPQLEQGDFSHDIMSEWEEYYRRSFAGECFTIIRRDTNENQEIYEEISFRPIMDSNTGIVAGVSCYARDITKQYLYTQMIERQNEQLKKIAWIQSHELRAPVANIMGLVALFNKNNAADPVNSDVINFIENAVRKMDDIVRRITEHTTTVQDLEDGFEKPQS